MLYKKNKEKIKIKISIDEARQPRGCGSFTSFRRCNEVKKKLRKYEARRWRGCGSADEYAGDAETLQYIRVDALTYRERASLDSSALLLYCFTALLLYCFTALLLCCTRASCAGDTCAGASGEAPLYMHRETCRERESRCSCFTALLLYYSFLR